MRSTFKFNRLVAFTFLKFEGNQEDYDVNHISKDTYDDKIDNLEIIKRKEHMRKDHGKAVLGLSKTLKYAIFRTEVEAAEMLGLKNKNISAALRKMGTSGGYKWCYFNSEEAQEIMKNHEQDITIKGQLQIDNQD
jgi:hypothetical protein